MKLRYETSRLLIYKVGWLMQSNKSAGMDAEIVPRCDSVSGTGFLTKLELEREMRDSVRSTLYSGTSEIQRNIIALGLRI